MTTMLELYRHRFGSAVKIQGNGWNGPCPLCGGTPGKSDRFMVWPDREKDLGHTCMEHNIPGVFSCRRCGVSGDSIKYLTEIEGMGFREACAELGISDVPVHHARRRPAPVEPQQARQVWQPSVRELPSGTWRAYAEKLLAEAEAGIGSHPEALKWLAARGITEEVIRAYRIGYLAGENGRAGRFRARSVLGLPPKQKDGREQHHLFIPRGIVIPTFEAGELINLRIRRPAPDIQSGADGRTPPKYMELAGSCSRPMLLRPEGGNPNLQAYIVVEGELDAILCHHAAGRRIGAVAIRSNQTKPDVVAHAELRKAVRILLALDYEESGAGIAGLDWWMSAYPSCLRWPTPEGKDPGNAFELGVDIREWLDGGLPGTIQLGRPSGRMDASASGSAASGGEGRSPERLPSGGKEGEPGPCTARADEAGRDEAGRDEADRDEADRDEADRADAQLLAALPAYLKPEDVPEDVVQAWRLWQGVPALFVKLPGGGFEWRYSRKWMKEHLRKFEAFWRFQDRSERLWDWLSAHAAQEIGAHNLLKVWG